MFIFMSSLLSNLADNLSEGLHNDKCTDCKSCLEYMSIKNNQLILRCFDCKKNYMDSWERFDEALLPKIEDFYIRLNMENITSVDYSHAKRVFKNFNNINIGNYHDLYVWSDTLLLLDVFQNFTNKCIKIYELGPANFLSAPGLACLKKQE